MDAFTTKEHTCFYVTVLDQHLPLAAELLSDILLRPLFAADDIDRERSVVLQEFRMVEDTPDDLIHDLFAERVWAGHPLGRPILGDRKIILEMERDTILAHFGEEYCPARITIAAAGRLEHGQLADLFGQGLRRLPPARRPPGRRHASGPDAAARPGGQVARAGPLRPRRLRAPPGGARPLRALSPERDLRRQHVLAPLPGSPRAAGAGVLDLLGQRRLPRLRPLLRLRRHRAGELPEGAPAGGRGAAEAQARGRDGRRAGSVPRSTSRGASCSPWSRRRAG